MYTTIGRDSINYSKIPMNSTQQATPKQCTITFPADYRKLITNITNIPGLNRHTPVMFANDQRIMFRNAQGLF